MAKWQYTKGLHDIGNGLFAYLLPDGSWGWSNAGLIVDGAETVLVDTLFDLKLTQDMLDTMRDAVPAAKDIGKLVNTHANADHIWGNQLVKDAEIIASTGCAEEFDHFLPETLIGLMTQSKEIGVLGEFVEHCFAPFDFSGIELTPPTTTFDDELTIQCGDKTINLYNVGPAHTRGDVLAYLPGDKVIFTGDIIFNEGHPVIWDGPIANWQSACERILALDVDVVVPGHGPVTDKAYVRKFKGYLDYIEAESRKGFDAGLSEWDAACEISLADYDTWLDAERVLGNVLALYREFRSDTSPPEVMPVFEAMARFHKEVIVPRLRG
ncbi:MAG: MBL fold metallo-hydrolase [Alphaproteobacteria bacterium]|nr:MBL fold metallo-hydrolase [Alphaproteobacteria bacterium]